MPLERTAARICREAGARMAENVLLRDLNLDAPVLDDRRLEVVANAQPIRGGAQVAVDTLVSPVRADGAPRPGADCEPGRALRQIRRRKRHHAYPEPAPTCPRSRARWPVTPGGGGICALARTRKVAPCSQTAARSCCAGVCAAAGCPPRSRRAALFGETCVDGAEPPVSDLLAARWENGPCPLEFAPVRYVSPRSCLDSTVGKRKRKHKK